MNNGDMLCEKFEISVFSEDELTDELKDHLSCCQRCRNFLKQAQRLENDLKSINLSGLKEGEIADKVISKISKSKKVPKHKFNIAHHMGTAAALVIICAIALYIKNIPGDISKEPVKADFSADEVQENYSQKYIVQDARFAQSAAAGDKAYLYADDFEAVSEEAVPEAYSEYDAEMVSDEDAKVEFDTASEEVSDLTANYTYDAYNTAVTQEAPQEKESSNSDGGVKRLMFSPSCANEAKEFEESVETKATDDDHYLVFQGMEFSEGDESFDSNIAKANARLSELYGDGFLTITRFCLENNGWRGNDFFFDYAPNMTYSQLISIQSSSSPIGE